MFSVNRQSLNLLFNTSSFRQATMMAFICLLISLASIILCNHLLEVVMRSHVRDMILADVKNQQMYGRLSNTAAVLQGLKQRHTFEIQNDQYSLLLSAQGELLYGQSALLPIAKISCDSGCETGWRHRIVRKAGLNNHSIRVNEILGLMVDLGDGGHYFSAYDLQPMLERTRIIPLITGAGLFLILLFILLCSLPFGFYNLYRINRIRDALGRFASGQHDVRIETRLRGDEFDQLSCEVNQAMDRITRLMEEVRSITSHVAHELRTPLTRLQSQLEAAVDRHPDQNLAELDRALAESERIQTLFKAVMRVGEVETGRCPHHFSEFDARALIMDVVDYYSPLAEYHHCELQVQAPALQPLYGDRDLLFQALANLIDNAFKYAPNAGAIQLFCHSSQDWFYLGVADKGQGIAESAKKRAVERFCRLEAAPDVQGNGLGLTLVNAIAELHGGCLMLEDNHPGLRVTLKLQRAPTGLRG